MQQRIQVLHAGKRRSNSNTFQIVAKATLERRRLRLHHLHRERGDQQTREVSPQQLVHYRDNWYLDAWCHLRNELRSFGLDAVGKWRNHKQVADSGFDVIQRIDGQPRPPQAPKATN